MRAFIGISKGKGVTSYLIRWFTSIIKRRTQMQIDGIGSFKAFWLTMLACFGLTKYAKLKVKFNHAFVIYWSEDFNRWFAIDIRERGICPVPVEKAFKECISVRLMRPKFDLWCGVKKTSRHFGKGYDWPGLFGAIWSIIVFVFTGNEPSNVYNSPGRFVCSEYVTTAINESGDKFYMGSPMKTYPDLLAELTSKSEFFTTVKEKKNFNINDLINV